MSDLSFSEFELTDAELRNVQTLLATTFPSAKHLTFEYLDWQYRKNPMGKAVGINAYASGELIAHYATIPLRSRLFDVSHDVLLSLNTATHSAFSGRGLFTKLASKTYEIALERGYSAVFGVANGNSTYGFLHKLGFSLLSPLEVVISLNTPDVDLNTSINADVFIEWGSDALAWRLSCPRMKYKWGVTKEMNRIVLAQSEVPGFEIILGFIAPPSLDQSPGWKSYKSIGPKVWIGKAQNINWSNSVKLHLPRFLRPSPLNLIFKDLTGELLPPRPENVFWQAMDFDAY